MAGCLHHRRVAQPRSGPGVGAAATGTFRAHSGRGLPGNLHSQICAATEGQDAGGQSPQSQSGPAFSTSAVPEGSTVPLATSDVTELIIEDHRMFTRLFKNYKASVKSAVPEQLPRELRQGMVLTLLQELSTHFVGEEEVLYPVVEKTLGKEMADRMSHEHEEVKPLLVELLAEPNVDDPDFNANVDKLMKSVLNHAADEENTMLPQFKAAPGNDVVLLRQLGEQFVTAKERWKNASLQPSI